MKTCTHDTAHKISSKKSKEHEEQCWLRIQGYTPEEKLLPEPLNSNANAIVKLNSKDINFIIENASKTDPEFKRGDVWDGPAPLTLERLQATYTVDERRAIYDAVVASDPTSHDISDLALNNVNEVKTEKKAKSRIEILSELRDMRRRRTKYRVAAKTKKYSDVLRDVIRTQMEMYTGIPNEQETVEKTTHAHKILHDDIKRERSSSLESLNRNKQMFSYENKSRASGSYTTNKRYESKGNTYSSRTKKDNVETYRGDKYNERHSSRHNVKDKSHLNLDNRRNNLREHERNRYRDKLHDSNKHDYYKRENKHKRGMNGDESRCRDESRKPKNIRHINNFRQEYKNHYENTYAAGIHQTKIKAEHKSNEDKYATGYNRTLKINPIKIKVEKE
ncbi:U11/U12 small nuclear ribonucleoprotein 48 kDa protein isoform X2 [Pieris rapae]|nr:U11/U12 small nuclear ribonucleoprotein 48 kDa protein isoform X2 [Pieris rapae]XP_022124390.2 U11/U12 small nuclear ribonucleoprotein 48 kDa protein isoform X2 [Pieris rapae]